jgi:hypothetical protein
MASPAGPRIYNKDMIWVAVAKLICPNTSPSYLVTRAQIEQEIKRLFKKTITPIQLERHLVSWEDRDADTAQPRRGGDRSRYLFRTLDGTTPLRQDQYRLYKKIDSQYDGAEKTGSTHPTKGRVPQKFHYLIEWYETTYF